MEDTNSKSKFSWFIILVLIIIIIILLFMLRIGKVEEKYLIPTGNVDVFDIDTVCSCKNSSCDNNNGNNTNLPVFDEDKDKKILGELFVDDKNGNYVFQQNLRIFDYAAYEYDSTTLVNGKIAPGVSNTYYFVVHNSSNVDVKYNIIMYEESQYKVNMKYRLKKNDKYIIGDDNNWVYADELETALAKLNSGSSDKYALDWQWFDDDVNDTIAGENMTSDYKLNIRFYYESIE